MFDEFEDFNDENFDEDDSLFNTNEIDQDIYDRTIDYFVRNNFKAIEENGIDIERMKLYSLDAGVLNQLKGTIQFMIEYFVEREEYEKCAILNKYMPELNEL